MRPSSYRLIPIAARVILAVVAPVVLAACTASGRPPSSRAANTSGLGGRIVTREQIAKLNVIDAYEVIERLSGYRLADNNRGDVSVRQRRGQTSLTNSNADKPALLVDGAMLSDYNLLRRIRATEIERIEIVSPGDATQRFGTSASGAGAIVVVTRSTP